MLPSRKSPMLEISCKRALRWDSRFLIVSMGAPFGCMTAIYGDYKGARQNFDKFHRLAVLTYQYSSKR